MPAKAPKGEKGSTGVSVLIKRKAQTSKLAKTVHVPQPFRLRTLNLPQLIRRICPTDFMSLLETFAEEYSILHLQSLLFDFFIDITNLNKQQPYHEHRYEFCNQLAKELHKDPIRRQTYLSLYAKKFTKKRKYHFLSFLMAKKDVSLISSFLEETKKQFLELEYNKYKCKQQYRFHAMQSALQYLRHQIPLLNPGTQEPLHIKKLRKTSLVCTNGYEYHLDNGKHKAISHFRFTLSKWSTHTLPQHITLHCDASFVLRILSFKFRFGRYGFFSLILKFCGYLENLHAPNPHRHISMRS